MQIIGGDNNIFINNPAMNVYSDDSSHLLTSFAFINIAFYFSYCLHYWHKDNEHFIARFLWYSNIALLLLTIWNYWFDGTTILHVDSAWWVFLGTLTIMLITFECIKISIGTVTTLVIFGIFVVILLGGRDYVISIFDNQIQPTSLDYIYLVIAFLVLAIGALVYIKLIRGKRYAEILMTGLTLSWVCTSGIQILRYEDATCGFCQTTVLVFNYDWVFFTAFALFAGVYFFIYWWTDKSENQTEQPQQQDEKLLDKQDTSNPIPSPTPSPSSTSDIDTSFSLPINTNIESEQLLGASGGAVAPPTTTGGRLGLLKWIRRSRRI